MLAAAAALLEVLLESRRQRQTVDQVQTDTAQDRELQRSNQTRTELISIPVIPAVL